MIKLLFLLILLAPSMLHAACTGSSPTWTSTPDRSSISTCVSNASAGDTINISAGDGGTWENYIEITKPLKIIGAGSSVVTITLDPATDAKYGAFYAHMTTTSLFRVSGIKFVTQNIGTIAYAVYFGGDMSQVQVDQCYFEKGKYAVNVDGKIRGVIHNNTFHNADASIQVLGGTTEQGNASWNSPNPIVAGMDIGLNALYIEDNTFIRDSALACGAVQNHIESGHGGIFVVRYNTFNGDNFCKTECTSSCSTGCYYDYHIMTHGNGGYYGDGSSVLRGHPIVETYNNTFSGNKVAAMIFRGGSNLAHDNSITEICSVPAITLIEEEGNGSPVFVPQDTVWPAEDQIFNSFFWNITHNESTIEDVDVDAGSTTFIQKDRDYFMHAPQSSGGKESFTDRPGAAGNGDDGTMTFSSSGANAYYPYTPYTYPHPLRVQKFTGNTCSGCGGYYN